MQIQHNSADVWRELDFRSAGDNRSEVSRSSAASCVRGLRVSIYRKVGREGRKWLTVGRNSIGQISEKFLTKKFRGKFLDEKISRKNFDEKIQ
jgi:hypothetical protein